MNLEEILSKLRKLKEFSFTNAAKNCDITAIDFLKGCKNLETVWIYHCDITDYAVLKNCPKLKAVYLANSSINTADDILELKGIEEIDLRKTPLSGNEKEMNKIYKTFPDTKIFINE